MVEWKWTKGEPYERSRRIFKEQTELNPYDYNDVGYQVNDDYDTNYDPND